MTDKKIKVTYTAEGLLDRHSGVRERIELSVEIDLNTESYPDTLEFLRSRVLENLDEETRNRHEKLEEEFSETARKLLDITEKLESAYKQWNIVSSFLKNQGLKTDTAEFPQEALTNLTKSLPTNTGGYPE